MRVIEFVKYWKDRLGINDYEITVEKISPMQVVCDSDDCTLVGVIRNQENHTAVIYHSRRLHEDDILHELLHVKHPPWTEDQINQETIRLIQLRKGGD